MAEMPQHLLSNDEVMTTVNTISSTTSPEDGNTVVSDHRTPSLETEASDTTEVASDTSSDDTNRQAALPAAPANTPSQSLAGDSSPVPFSPDFDDATLAERLQAMPAGLTPPSSTRSSRQGKRARLQAIFEGRTPLGILLFKLPAPPKRSNRRRGYEIANMSLQNKVQSRLRRVETAYDLPDREATPEHSTWADIAEEDVVRALSRMAMVAKDEHKNSGGLLSASDAYSIRLAKLLDNAEIKFDSKRLRQNREEQ